MTRPLVGLGLVLALVPASAGAGAAGARTDAVAASRPVALTAAPARLVLLGSGGAIVRLRNAGARRVAVDVAAAGFALDLDGRPRIAGRHSARSAASWLTLRPARLVLGPRSTARLLVSARVPPHAAPGDHDALALLTARPLGGAEVAVRLRLGVVVVVRAPGTVVRRLELGRLRVKRRGATSVLELSVVNAGNVTERLLRTHAALTRLSTGQGVASVAAAARELRPRTRGLLEFRLPARAHGRVAARVVIPAEQGRRVIRRTYRIRI